MREEEEFEEYERQCEVIERRYAEAFGSYAQRFTAAVHAAAAATGGLTVPVEVSAETDPQAAHRAGSPANPDEWDEGDGLPWLLWSAARQAVGLLEIDLRR